MQISTKMDAGAVNYEDRGSAMIVSRQADGCIYVDRWYDKQISTKIDSGAVDQKYEDRGSAMIVSRQAGGCIDDDI